MDHAAIVVSGSNLYVNYRHQANAAHTRNLLVNNGMPSENVVLMMYNDMHNADYTNNSYPGHLYD